MQRTEFVTALLFCAVIGLFGVASAQDAVRPTILSVTMTAAGDLLIITGTGFGPAPVVTIDGHPTPVLADSTDTQVTVVTPAVLLTTPGTYRLTMVDSVRQVGEMFVVASRAGLVPAVSLTPGETSVAPNGAGVVTADQPRATGAAAPAPGAGSGETVGTSAVEDSGSPYRTAFGFEALNTNAPGALFNTAIGFRALTYNTFGGNNTASGVNALFANTWGSDNTGTGASVLPANTTGSRNTASGVQALYANTTGSRNTASGWSALVANTTGSNNTALGDQAGIGATTGHYNLFLGARVFGTSADTNTIRIGSAYDVGLVPPSGQNQTFIAGIRGTSVSGGFPVVIDAAGKLGTADGLGNFGIGTMTPAEKLDVVGNVLLKPVSGVASKIRLWNATSTTETFISDLGVGGSSELVIAPGFIEKMRIKSSGGADLYGALTVKPLAGVASSLRLWNGASNSEVFLRDVGAPGASEFVLEPGGVEKLRVRSSSTADLYGNLQLRPVSGVGAKLQLWNATSTNQSYIRDIGTTGVSTLVVEPAGVEAMRIHASGHVFVTGNVCAANVPCVSDARLKQHVRRLDYGLAHVMRLRPVSWSWIDRTQRQLPIGLIAQEVEGVIPELIMRDADADKPLGLNYLGLLPVIITAIQEQQDVITRLKADNTTLRDQNAALDARLAALEQALQQSRAQQ